jgi:hypothetical protein
MKGYIIARLSETSTWKGLIMLLAGVLGLDASGDEVRVSADQIISAGAALAGLLGAALPDKIAP